MAYCDECEKTGGSCGDMTKTTALGAAPVGNWVLVDPSDWPAPGTQMQVVFANAQCPNSGEIVVWIDHQSVVWGYFYPKPEPSNVFSVYRWNGSIGDTSWFPCPNVSNAPSQGDSGFYAGGGGFNRSTPKPTGPQHLMGLGDTAASATGTSTAGVLFAMAIGVGIGAFFGYAAAAPMRIDPWKDDPRTGRRLRNPAHENFIGRRVELPAHIRGSRIGVVRDVHGAMLVIEVTHPYKRLVRVRKDRVTLI